MLQKTPMHRHTENTDSLYPRLYNSGSMFHDQCPVGGANRESRLMADGINNFFFTLQEHSLWGVVCDR